MMKRTLLILSVIGLLSLNAQAQYDKEEKEKGFRKENLFAGGSISLGFSSNSFQMGANPFFGYSVTSWLDAGIVGNYNYASYRDLYYDSQGDKIKENVYGGGGFVRLYPVRFLFAQAQFEHNFITQKYIPGNGTATSSIKQDASSFLIGAGYTSNRYPGSGQPFFYLSILFDVMDNDFSPYTDGTGRIIPIIRGGVQVPLFQGRNSTR